MSDIGKFTSRWMRAVVASRESLVGRRDCKFVFGLVLLEDVGAKRKRKICNEMGDLHAVVYICRGPIAKLVPNETTLLNVA